MPFLNSRFEIHSQLQGLLFFFFLSDYNYLVNKNLMSTYNDLLEVFKIVNYSGEFITRRLLKEMNSI